MTESIRDKINNYTKRVGNNVLPGLGDILTADVRNYRAIGITLTSSLLLALPACAYNSQRPEAINAQETYEGEREPLDERLAKFLGTIPGYKPEGSVDHISMHYWIAKYTSTTGEDVLLLNGSTVTFVDKGDDGELDMVIEGGDGIGYHELPSWRTQQGGWEDRFERTFESSLQEFELISGFKGLQESRDR